nr:hypothetical protein [Tanacetum cinerariifolium]
IAQSFALPPVADEHVSPMRDVSQGEACPTNSGFVADQDRANIAKTSTLPHEDDAPCKGRRLNEEEVATERVSSDIEEIRLDEGEVVAERV